MVILFDIFKPAPLRGRLCYVYKFLDHTMSILYKIISIIINAVALFLSISLVFSIPMLISSPITLLSAFLIVGVVLYAWFSAKFYRQVVQQKKTVQHRLRDWVRVNGIVTMVFCSITFMNVLLLLKKPELFSDAAKTMGVDMPVKIVNSFFYGMLAYAILLLIHVLWTFSLLKKNKDFFAM